MERAIHNAFQWLSEFLARPSRLGALREYILRFFKMIRGISIYGMNVEFSWGREGPSLIQILTILDEAAKEYGENITIVFDEIQRISGAPALDLQMLLPTPMII